MNVKKFLPLIAAAGLGLIALIVAHSGLGRVVSSDKGDKSAKIIVAKENIAPGQQLNAENVSEQAINIASVPPTAFTQMSDVMSRVTVAPMVAGQPVLSTFLAATGALPGLPALIPPGMRAVTIDVNETTGVAGLIQPGSHVDLVSVINQGEHENSCARTIASNVPVVAVGQRLSSIQTDADKGVAHTVTLLVKSKEAELIKLASSATNLSLVLRGNGDFGQADTRGVMFKEMTSGMQINHDHDPTTTIVENPGQGTTENPTPGGPATMPAAHPQVAYFAPQTHLVHVTLYQGGMASTVSYSVPGPDTSNPSDNDIDNYSGGRDNQDFQKH